MVSREAAPRLVANLKPGRRCRPEPIETEKPA
jgi:hypothetical protein